MSEHQPTHERPTNEIDTLRDRVEEVLGNWYLSRTRLARPEERKSVASRINAETAFVFHDYIDDLDPYCDHPEGPVVQVSRASFVAGREERIAVGLWELPETTRLAIRSKVAAQNLEARRIIGELFNLGRAGTDTARDGS